MIVPGKIQEEIKQSKPFASRQGEAILNIQRTADLLERKIGDLLKPHGLTSRQYNVLRILRGAGKCGASCKEIGSRMVTADPDVTRLIDRMEVRGLVTRGRAEQDRRVVAIHVTESGLALLASLDKPVDELGISSMSALSVEEVDQLIGLLERLRAPW